MPMTKNTQRILLLAAFALGVTACPTDPVPTDAPVPPTDTPSTEDTGGGDEDAPVTPGNDCATLCAAVTANCSADNIQYMDAAQCAAYCAAAAWPAGDVGDMTGNTIACRIYHAGVAAGDPDTHCGHAGPTGGSVCGAAITFRSDAATMYTRVDRMGQPAVSTALIPSARKNAYNDASPADDVGTPGFVPDLAGSLTGLHVALDGDLGTLGLTPCSMTTLVDAGPGFGMLPECFGQRVAGPGTPPVAALVLPDTVAFDPDFPPGFPNGRQLEDQVIDGILAAILLQLGNATGCGGGMCSVGTFIAIPLNPPGNDVPDTVTTFPYLEAAHPAP
jgi:hypothetical protein